MKNKMFGRYSGRSAFVPSLISAAVGGLIVTSQSKQQYYFTNDHPLYGYFYNMYYNPQSYVPWYRRGWYGLPFMGGGYGAGSYGSPNRFW